ncbi:gastrula zinc finger protein XlCGF49.1-like [Trichogramma pretiosum]|uniref:gastrula zinc finger protein XlCGF49.1-like n=1 Tax=Trichogramma pretiosum TaxID=7493 RepID=UPI0006C9720B|nr:gastrula zinc finger protein XlCGF49.1-like [Trichogramma pretiosum]
MNFSGLPICNIRVQKRPSDAWSMVNNSGISDEEPDSENVQLSPCLEKDSTKNCCDICGKKFLLKSNLQYHIKFIHNSISYPCAVCGKTFSLECNLFIHINYMHKPHKCKNCPGRFSTENDLKKHFDSVHLHACYKCGKKCKTKKSHKKHINLCSSK